MKGMMKRLKNWVYPHKCTVYQKYYSRNLKVCDDCKISTPLWDVKIKHQR